MIIPLCLTTLFISLPSSTLAESSTIVSSPKTSVSSPLRMIDEIFNITSIPEIVANMSTAPALAGYPMPQRKFRLPIFDYNTVAPPQTSKNCHGSIFCSTTGRACQVAAAKYKDIHRYTAYTSYVQVSHSSRELASCAAIFSCDNGGYGAGWSGKQIKQAFKRLWVPEAGEGKRCRHCGSSYSEGGCHVTANYCHDCKSSNTEREVFFNDVAFDFSRADPMAGTPP